MQLWLVWLIIAGAALAGEAATLGLFLGSIGIAAAITALISLTAPLWLQAVLFCALTLLLIAVVRPVAVRALPRGRSDDGPPADTPVGRHGVVVDEISATGGEIRIGQGGFWSARPAQRGAVLEPGATVEVVAMQGFTALVQPVSGDLEGPPHALTAPHGVPAPAGNPATIEPPLSPDPFGLSVREVEVLQLVAVGLSNAEIAQRLFLSQRTVDHHVSHILTKMDASGRVEAVRLAIERGLVTVGDESGQ